MIKYIMLLDLTELLETNYSNTDEELKKKLKPWFDRDVNWIQNDGNTLHNLFFKQFENIHSGKTGIIFSGSATIEECNAQNIPNFNESIKIGMNWMNNSKYKNNINYYFFGSYYNNNEEYKNNIEKYNNVIKFASVFREGKEIHKNVTKTQISKSQADELGAYSFDSCLSSLNTKKDISVNRVLGNSIAFPAIFFGLYTGLTTIYLVGMDCTQGKSGSDYSGEMVYLWNTVKKYINNNYANVRIISINPIGLKGLFEDIYI